MLIPFVISLDYNNATWENRKIALDELNLIHIKELDIFNHEHFVLETCNRIEIVVISNQANIDNLLSTAKNWNTAIVYKDNQAINHLIYLCAGLKSQSFGDPQIFGQVKHAFTTYTYLGYSAKAMLKLMNNINRNVKTIRHTFFNSSNNNPTAKTIAIKIREYIFNNKKAKILVLGAGDMSQAVIPYIRQFDVTIASRTHTRAINLADQYKLPTITLGQALNDINEYDILISCLKLSKPIEIPTNNTPNLIFDLGFPPNISNIDKNTVYYHIDHFPDLVTEESFKEYVFSKTIDLIN